MAAVGEVEEPEVAVEEEEMLAEAEAAGELVEEEEDLVVVVMLDVILDVDEILGRRTRKQIRFRAVPIAKRQDQL